MPDPTALAKLADEMERATPSRWVTLGCSFGVLSAWMIVAGILKSNELEALSELAGRIGIVASALTWWEVRRFKYVAAALRAQGGAS